MSIKAGGVGLNLTQANHIILLEPYWNIPYEEQAIARVHRIGQTEEVHVHRLSVEETIEQWILLLQEHKLKQIDVLFKKGKKRNTNRNFTEEDLRKLFRESCF